ncbi:hypothetical protein ALO94_200738 [Pseudomonas syringae pv. spinaceae]|uniref:Pyridine nucleotide-disulfide oxidoreductase n=1 Tax=Pseudomonas syringae pv. spinaceae TaxID=264459 RepID=A0A0Q0EXC2_PSESX|nr:hypothetical protein ALO94_200738 [Pseudomonas syringae pv. spinaceae]
MNASGRNTAANTRVMPKIAPDTCCIAFTVAAAGERPSSAMMRSTFSTTTMASSTRIPMASTMPNMVIMFTEKPSRYMIASVPARHTGTTMVGISV